MLFTSNGSDTGRGQAKGSPQAKIQLLRVFVNKILLERSHGHSLTCVVSTRQWQNWVVKTETVFG